MIEDIYAALPEIVLALGAMLALMTGVFIKNSDTGVLVVSRLSSIILVIGLAAIFFVPRTGADYFNHLFILDNFAILSKAIIIFAATIVLMMSFRFIDDRDTNIGFEYPILILLSVVGMLIMVSANDLLTLYLGLELQSLALYVLAAIRRDDVRASEAAIKYFVLGALASGLLLYGASLVYGYLGSTNFASISQLIALNSEIPKPAIIGLVLVATGLLFKISAAPFHMWTPDVYEGVPTPVTAYFAIVPKLAAMALIIRIFSDTFHDFTHIWQQVIVAASLLSMAVGAFGGLWQGNIKRLLAYSSIGHMGYALLGVAAGTEVGVQSVIAYFVIYILNSVPIFLILLSARVRSGVEENGLERLDHFKGLARSNPLVAVIMTLSLVSMIGLPFPPYPGFFGKFFVFGAAVGSGLFVLAVLGVLFSVVAAYYYLKIIKLMYLDSADDKTRVSISIDSIGGFILTIITIISLVIFVQPSSLMAIAGIAASSLF